MKRSILCLSIVFLLTGIIPYQLSAQDQSIKDPKTPKNVILLIGDGMGFAQVQSQILQSEWNSNFLRFPVTGISQTQASDNLITDSGAGGTAIACGQRTKNGMIGMTPDNREMLSLVDIFSSLGKATGVVVTCAITHATPADFLAHDESRSHLEAIAEDIANCNVDVIIGGGLKDFNQRTDGKDLTQTMRANGMEVYTNLRDVSNKTGRFAVFIAEEHPKQANEGRGDELSVSVKTAIEALSTDQDGFFLMIEGSQIDWAGHKNDSAYLVAEMRDFDQVLGEVLDFAAKDGNTLVVVTADHETGGLTLPGITEGNHAKVRYAFSTGDHTACFVPVFAFGPSSEYFTGIYKNNEIFGKILYSSNIAR
ncbi:MAG: alkaline phosphatase [Bacteroidales bacterium]